MNSIFLLEELKNELSQRLYISDSIYGDEYIDGKNTGIKVCIEIINEKIAALTAPIKLSTMDDFKAHIGRVVTFSEHIEETESDFDPGMKARIESVELDDSEVFSVKFNFKDFLDHNRKFMKHNYYNNEGIACLTWEESGFFPRHFVVEDYFGTDYNNSIYFSMVE